MNELAVFSKRHKEILAGARAARVGGAWHDSTEGVGKRRLGFRRRAPFSPQLPTALKRHCCGVRLVDALPPMLVQIK